MLPDSYEIKPIHKPSSGPARARQLDHESRERASTYAPAPVQTTGGGWLDYVVVDAACELIGGVASSTFDVAGDVCGSIGEGVGDLIGGVFEAF